MQYPVTMEFVEPGPLFSPQQLGHMVEETRLPGFDLLAGLSVEGKLVAGGVLAGTRTASVIVAAASNDDLDQMIEGILFGAVLKTDVVPRQLFPGAQRTIARC